MDQAGGNGNADGRNAAMLQQEEEGAQLTDIFDNNGPGLLPTCSMSWAEATSYQAPVRRVGGGWHSKTMGGTIGTVAQSSFRKWGKAAVTGGLSLSAATRQRTEAKRSLTVCSGGGKGLGDGQGVSH
eukprot:7675416-Ditylum_brightwellii.AAC.1